MKQKRMKRALALSMSAFITLSSLPVQAAGMQVSNEEEKRPLIHFDMEALEEGKLINQTTKEVVEVTGNPSLEKGKEGEKSLRLDGDTYIDLGTSFQPDRDYTLMGWIKQDTGATDGQAFVSRSFSGVIDDQLGIMLKNGTVIHEVSFKKGTSNTDYQAITSPADAQAGTWNHIAVIRLGAVVNIYINGVLAKEQIGLSEESFVENEKIMYVGRDCDRSGVPYKQHAYRGLMDDLRLYDEALDASEVQEIYAECKNGFTFEEVTNGKLVLKLDKAPQSEPQLTDFSAEFKDGEKYLSTKLESCEYDGENLKVVLAFPPIENHSQAEKTISVSLTYADERLLTELAVPSAGDNEAPSVKEVGVKNISPKLGSKPCVKGMLEAEYTFEDPDGDASGDMKYQWYASDAIDGDYAPIQGIRTRTVILLEEYVGKYLKCQVTPVDCHGNAGESVMSAPTKQPVQATQGNPLTDWMHEGGYGVSHHFLSNYFNLSHVYASPEEKWDRSKMTWNEFVGQFDAESYAEQIHDIGAKFVILTVGQNSGSYCAPNPVYDKYMREAGLLAEGEENPKTVSMENDLPMKIANALEKYDIKLILYLPSNPPHSASWDESGTPNGYGYFTDYLVTKKVFDYTPGTDGVPNQRSRKVLSEMVQWWSLHYGDKISGWWFDGCYPWGILQSQMDMSLEYNLSTLANAAKAGNPYNIVTFNQGLDVNWAFNKSNPYQDYTAGESQGMNTFPVKGRWAKDSTDCQNFMFGPIGNRDNWSAGWGCKGTSRTEEFMIDAIRNGRGNEYAMGFDTKVNIFGQLDPEQYQQLRNVKTAIWGDEEEDALEEAVKKAEEAQKRAEEAQAAAEKARQEAQAASQEAERLEQEAEKYKQQAQAAREEALKYKQAAETASQEAKKAEEASIKVKEEAKAAQSEAKKAQEAAEEAAKQAGADSEAAKEARKEAQKKAEEAEEAKKAAALSEEQAKTAQAEAEEAKKAAQASQTAAETAQREAKRAREEAEAAFEESRAVLEEAKAAQAVAEAKAAEAKAYAAEVEALLKKTEEKKEEAEEARKKAEEERIAAGKALKEAQEALKKANEARAAAEKAQEEAEKARDEARKAAEGAAMQPDQKLKKAAIKSAKSAKKQELKVIWRKVTGADGYELQYATNAGFKKAVTKKAGKRKTSLKIKKLKSKKKYYLRIRAYKVTDGVKTYGSYSKAGKAAVK